MICKQLCARLPEPAQLFGRRQQLAVPTPQSSLLPRCRLLTPGANGLIVNFGIEQAQDYLHGLSDRFKALAEDPLQGRVADEFASGLSRYEYQSHVIFFREMEQYTLIVRHTQVRRREWVVRAIRTQDYT